MQVLLVEDEEVRSRFLQLELEDLGMQVDVHTTAAEALNACEAQRYDVAIFDMGFSDTQNAELALRCRAAQPLLPIILVTSPQCDLLTATLASDRGIRLLRRSLEADHLIEALGNVCD